jgi:haloacid dehalogenase-like hydrolase
VQGHHQTDLIAAGSQQGTGATGPGRSAGRKRRDALVMAVGDTASDLEMFRLAKLSFAPGNADATVKSATGVTVVRPAAQAGFSVAVARLIGHRPGACAACAPPRLGAPASSFSTCWRSKTSAAYGRPFGQRGSCAPPAALLIECR